MSDLVLDLSAVALAHGLKLAGAEAITTYREDGENADGAAREPPPRTAPRACEPGREGTALARRQNQRRPEPNLEDSSGTPGRQGRPDR
jgi:hypothetical protein